MRLPLEAHTDRPWRIHEIAPDFLVEDVWSYRTPGAGPDDFPQMIAALDALGGLDNPKQHPAVRFLFAVRWKLGALLGWDKPKTGLAGRVRSLVERLPDDLRQDDAGAPVTGTPFTRVYEIGNEYAMELANKTVHTVCHLSWVQGDDGDYELHMAALVKPNDTFGRLYMGFIKPFRYLIVYPIMTRQWERAWRDRPTPSPTPPPNTNLDAMPDKAPNATPAPGTGTGTTLDAAPDTAPSATPDTGADTGTGTGARVG
ncbi:DUF2867 domain-containing protein [Actinomadura rupiterrae]|uniref:DUF2867 domain-containing protein n=1 Tax=Actinomadura rupiterrae TaxID=559627 RepID=UPI0020A5606F|nr:DUF2867 domain-containing protein [Actinomadura rupiterrae]MCP2339445.1 hypothetical protein [Actinomadura rupiterrae]